MKFLTGAIVSLALISLSLGASLSENKDPGKERYLGISIVGGIDTVKAGSNGVPAIIAGGILGGNGNSGRYGNQQGRYPPNSGGDRDRYPPNSGGDRDRYPPNSGGDRDRYPPNSGGDRDRYPPNSGGDRDRYPPNSEGDRDRYPPNSGGDRDRYPPNSGGDRDRYPQFDYVTFYELPYFRGWSFKAPLSRKCRNLESDYNNYNNGISSIKTHGNCVVVYTRYDCRGREFTIRPRYEDHHNHNNNNGNYRPIGHSELAEDLNNSISSYRTC